METPYCTVYITACDVEEARRIGRALVGERLVACVNILGPVESVYRWNDEVCEDPEVALLAKTRQSLVDAVVARVEKLHSYDCPCVVALPMVGGSPAYFKWMDRAVCHSPDHR